MPISTTRYEYNKFDGDLNGAGSAMASLHSCMPVILKEEIWEDWLDSRTDVASAKELMQRNRGVDLTAYRVDRKVNSSSYNGTD